MNDKPFDIEIAIAFPKHDADRILLRILVPEAPLPALYVDGVDRPCPDCGVMLNVGPRVAASGVTAYCPLCAMRRCGSAHTTIADLGNPDSKPE